MTQKPIKKHPKTVTITRNDLSRALKKPWSQKTCLLATTAKRVGLYRNGDPDPWELVGKSGKAQTAMGLFDGFHRNGKTNLLPKLKAMLPIKVKLQ